MEEGKATQETYGGEQSWEHQREKKHGKNSELKETNGGKRAIGCYWGVSGSMSQRARRKEPLKLRVNPRLKGKVNGSVRL